MTRLILYILALYTAFLAGVGSMYYLQKYVYSQKLPISPLNTPICNVVPTPVPNDSKLLDLEDFDILLASEADPKILIEINHLNNRAEGYKQAQLTYMFDGKTLKEAIIPYENIRVTQITTNRDNLEFSVEGNFNAGGKDISFNIPSIDLGMVIRAQPTVGKYGGSTVSPSATIYINGEKFQAYGALTAGFFNSYIPVDTKDMKVKTYWMMFWDKDWTFYHLDKSDMEKSNKEYYPHTYFSSFSKAKTVQYYTGLNLSNLTVGSFGFDYDLLGNPKRFNFILGSSVVPYTGAKMYLATPTEGGVGLLLNLVAQ